MRHSKKIGISFGLTSGLITTLGLMIGLYSGTNSRLVVIGGILTIAIADSLSDSLGIHISEESENKHTHIEIWESTFFTFLSKLIISASFIIPVLLLDLNSAIIISIIWGFFLLSLFSYYISKNQKVKSSKVIIEHLIIGISVIIIAHYIGYWVSITFI